MIEESGIFIRQVLKLKAKYRSVESDIAVLKLELPKLAFHSISPRNIHIVTVDRSGPATKQVWRIRVLNSDVKKGKRGGYRLFYCEGKVEKSILLLNIYPKTDIKDNEYQTIAKDLVEACFE
jgi:mRNA-degrading endonuclease RelE of RelBE toxin-antitoxin system